MKVYVPSVNIPVNIQIRTIIHRVNTELNLNTTVANAWEVLSFDFGSQPSNLYDRIDNNI